MSGNKIRLGIVGLGHVADHQLAALKLLDEKYSLAGVCDQDARQFIKAPDVPAFPDVEKLLEECDLDCVLVSVPNREHFAVAEFVLSRRVGVLLEKPATETVEQFERLCSVASESGLLLHTAFHAAFARELHWFISERNRSFSGFGPITGIRCGFYDPYFQHGDLSPGALSLGGSWVDSGINALSLVATLLPDFTLEAARMTKIPGVDCLQLQGSVDFSFPVRNSPYCGHGLIDTNWTLGLNHKSTHIFFAESGHRIWLNHSGQNAKLISSVGSVSTVADFSRVLPRMTAHYVGVFDDFYENFMQKTDNRSHSLKLMRKLCFEDDFEPQLHD